MLSGINYQVCLKSNTDDVEVIVHCPHLNLIISVVSYNLKKAIFSFKAKNS